MCMMMLLLFIVLLAYISSFAANDANVGRIQEEILSIKRSLESIEMETLRMIKCNEVSCLYAENGRCTKDAITIESGKCVSYKRGLNYRDLDQYIVIKDTQTNASKVVPANFTGVWLEVNESE